MGKSYIEIVGAGIKHGLVCYDCGKILRVFASDSDLRLVCEKHSKASFNRYALVDQGLDLKTEYLMLLGMTEKEYCNLIKLQKPADIIKDYEEKKHAEENNGR